MIHVITHANRHLYEGVLADMHHARNEYFVKVRGWTNLTVENGGEFDAYDDKRAIYLVGLETDGSVAVSVRLVPAVGGCILADAFPPLVSAGPVREEGVYEMSRYFASRARRGAAGFAMRSALHVAVLEAAVDRNVQRMIGFTDVHIMALFRYTGWRVRPIGLPQAYDEGTAGAFEIACQPEDLEHTRSVLRLPGRQLFEASERLPAGADVQALAHATDVILNAPSAVRDSVMEVVSQASARWTPQGDLGELIAQLGARAAA